MVRGLRTVYSSMSTVRSSAKFLGSVDLDVLDDQGVGVEHLHLRIALSVL